MVCKNCEFFYGLGLIRIRVLVVLLDNVLDKVIFEWKFLYFVIITYYYWNEKRKDDDKYLR